MFSAVISVLFLWDGSVSCTVVGDEPVFDERS